MKIADEARRILEDAGYSVFPNAEDKTLAFEDQSLLGFVWEAPTVEALLAECGHRQDIFLASQDRSLRQANEKSWNVYSIVLTEDEPTPEKLSQLARIEEDFRGTRKIARSGVTTTPHLISALLPLLPIQNALGLADSDIAERIRNRLSAIDREFADALLNSSGTEAATKAIMGSNENQ